MSLEFVAVSDPPSGLYQEICALAPTNPFYTEHYAQAQRTLGAGAWVFGLREGDELRVACTGFLRSGRVARILEIPSVPGAASADRFWQELAQFCRRAKVSDLEVNSFASEPAQIPALHGEFGRRSRTEYVLDLQKPGLWENLSSNHGRNIKRGRKAGLEIRRTRDAGACREHACLMDTSLERRRQRAESISATAIPDEVAAYIQSGAGELFQAVLGETVLSSVLVLAAEQGGYYQSAGTSPEGMACGASHFLIREIGETLRNQGSAVFNLGGAGSESTGLVRFKTGFGTTPRDLEALSVTLGGPLRKGLIAVARSLRRWQRAAPEEGRA